MKNYYNQNPQQVYLLEKIEEQEKVIARLRNDIDYLLNQHEEKAEVYNQLIVSIIKFNLLSPFKKMFYKFKV